MTEYRSLLERAGANAPAPDIELERVLRRRDRKRRNQRIAAGVVGIAVFVAAVWIVTSGLSLDRSETSVVPGGDVNAEPADVREPARCKFVQPPARAHLELRDLGQRFEVRYVLHQMTIPGHPWEIGLHHVRDWPDPGDRDAVVIFHDTFMATGDSGDIRITRRVTDTGGYDVFFGKAVDTVTGQVCYVWTRVE